MDKIDRAEAFFIGLSAAFILGMVFALGMTAQKSMIAQDCKAFGHFAHHSDVYECRKDVIGNHMGQQPTDR